jgi:hypothetical protein
MDTTILLLLLLVAAIFVVRGNSEGWRPFAWYGAPPGTYQGSGDWDGVVPATTSVEVVAPASPPVRKPKKS